MRDASARPVTQRYVISNWAILIAEALEARQVRSEDLYTRAGLDLHAIRRGGFRMSSRLFNDLCLLVSATLDDDAFGLEVGRRLHPGTFQAVALPLLTSTTLEEVFSRLARYMPLISDVCRLEIRTIGQEMHVQINTLEEDAAPLRILSFVAALMKLVREVADPHLCATQVSLGAFPRPCCRAANDAISAYFGCPVAFGANEIAMRFRVADARRVLSAANSELARWGEDLAEDHLSRAGRGQLGDRLAGEIALWLPRGVPSGREIAAKLGMSERTMQRRLAAEDLTYGAVMDQVRRQAAMRLIKEGRLAIKEVAFRVGYSDLSNFSRAFRSWFGQAPGQFQRSIAATHKDK